MTAAMTSLQQNIASNSRSSLRLTGTSESVTRLLILLVLNLIAGSLWPGLQAQPTDALTLAPTGGATMVVQPGEVTTINFRIARSSNKYVTYIGATDLPRGWRSLLGEGVFDLGNHVSMIRLVSFSVPENTPAGKYPITYEVRDYASGRILSQARITITVQAKYRLDLKAIEYPRFALTGTSYSVVFLLTNESNESARVRVHTRNTPSFPVETDSSELSLFPGEARDIQVTVPTDPLRRFQYRHSLELHALLAADTTVRSRASTMITVLPAVSIEEESFKVPLQMTLRWTGENSQKGGQVELYGSGSFSQNPTDAYELVLRGPNNRTQSFLGQRDEYRLAYSNAEMDVVLGDQAYQLSPLTEFGRYAFGLRSQLRFNQMSIGGFVNQTRWIPTRWEQRAAYATYHFHEGGSIGLNYLRKDDNESSDIFTLQSAFKAFEKGNVAVELGGSRSGEETGNALSVSFGSRTDRIVYSFNQIYADSRYAGFYRDFDARTLTVVVFPWDRIRFEGYFRDEKRNLDKILGQLYAPHTRQYQAGVGYGSYASLSVRVTQQKDLLPVPKFEREETVGLLRLGAAFTSASVVAHFDFGRSREELLGKSYPLQRFALSTNFRPDEHQGYSVSIEYASTKDLFTDETRRGTSQNIMAWYKPTRMLQVQLGIYRNVTLSPFPQSHTLADLAVDYTLPFGHNISLQARVNHITSSSLANDAAYSLDYVIPIQFAFTKEEEGSMLTGRLFDVETGLAIPHVILYAGEKVAVSDEEGSFRFPHLKEETYPLSIDRATIGPDRITRQPFPLNVSTRPGKDLHLEIGITKSCSVVGQILQSDEQVMFQFDSSDVSEERKRGFAGGVVELRSESEVFRRVTDGRGWFRFLDLRPGTWSVSIVEEGMSGLTNAESSMQTIEIKPGERREVQFTRLTEKRHPRIIEKGKILNHDLRK